MVQWNCKIRSLGNVLVSPDARMAHAKKYLKQVCGLEILEDVREPEKPAAEPVGRFPWDREPMPVEVT